MINIKEKVGSMWRQRENIVSQNEPTRLAGSTLFWVYFGRVLEGTNFYHCKTKCGRKQKQKQKQIPIFHISTKIKLNILKEIQKQKIYLRCTIVEICKSKRKKKNLKMKTW